MTVKVKKSANELASDISKNVMAGRPSSVPPHQWVGHWLTISEFSRLMGRAPRTGYNWIRTGILPEFGISTYEFRMGKKHSARIFVRNPYA
jgi:hypothetical protein